MRRVGTLDWARRTHGRLSRRDRVALLVQGMRRSLPRGSRLGAALDLDSYQPPDTPIAREAEWMCHEASTPVLEAHCYRTHLWGVAIADAEGVEYDVERFYAAALTHDLGLTERFRGHDPDAGCFSLDSASALRELLGDYPGVSIMEEAITLHLNAHVPLSQGPEAYLLQLGAAIDVTGYRLRDVARDTRREILERHPRGAMKDEFKSLMDEEVRVHPDSRPAFFTKRVGFKRMIDRAPFDS